MIVSIKDSPYELRYGLKGLFIFEEIEGHPFEGKVLKESYLLMHACLLAYNPSYSFSFDELLEICDEDNNLFSSFMEVLGEVSKRDQSIKKKVM